MRNRLIENPYLPRFSRSFLTLASLVLVFSVLVSSGSNPFATNESSALASWSADQCAIPELSRDDSGLPVATSKHKVLTLAAQHLRAVLPPQPLTPYYNSPAIRAPPVA